MPPSKISVCIDNRARSGIKLQTMTIIFRLWSLFCVSLAVQHETVVGVTSCGHIDGGGGGVAVPLLVPRYPSATVFYVSYYLSICALVFLFLIMCTRYQSLLLFGTTGIAHLLGSETHVASLVLENHMTAI